MTKTNKEIVLEVADFMEKMPKLVKGIYKHYDKDSAQECYCIKGAFYEVANIGDYSPLIIKLQNLFPEVPAQYQRQFGCPIAYYNDLPSTTKEDVVNLLRKVADKL